MPGPSDCTRSSAMGNGPNRWSRRRVRVPVVSARLTGGGWEEASLLRPASMEFDDGPTGIEPASTARKAGQSRSEANADERMVQVGMFWPNRYAPMAICDVL